MNMPYPQRFYMCPQRGELPCGAIFVICPFATSRFAAPALVWKGCSKASTSHFIIAAIHSLRRQKSWISSIKEITGKFLVANEAMQNSFHPPSGNFGKRCLLHIMVDH